MGKPAQIASLPGQQKANWNSTHSLSELAIFCEKYVTVELMSDKGRPLPKFGEWDVNDPASADEFTVIFNKARDEKKTGGKPESPARAVLIISMD